MADPADRAQQDAEAYEQQLADKFKGDPYEPPVGVAGECDECGEHSERLIDGLCATCRDKLAEAAKRRGRRR